MARRRSRITSRIAKLKGITENEKAMLTRIGELIDGAINNRGPANPGLIRRRRVVRRKTLPPPKTVDVKSNILAAKIEWNAVDSSELNFYEVTVVNDNTGETTERVSFTNRLSIGEQAGNFTGRVRSIARNGDASPFLEFAFEIQSDVLFLEGAKHGITTIATTVEEPIYTPSTYKVFVWGSFNIAGFADPSFNRQPSITLSRIDEFGNELVQQTIPMFPESTTFVNIDDDALGITRPAGTPSRTGNLESSQGVMFSPIDVESDWADKENTFKLTMSGREFENDIVSLAITIWVIPGSISSIEEEFIVLGDSINVIGANAVRNNNLNTYGFGAGSFTLSAWIKYPPAYLNSTRIGTLYSFVDPAAGSLQTIQTTFGSTSVGQNGYTISVERGASQNIARYPQIEEFIDNVNKWVNVTISWNNSRASITGSQRTRLYINGKLVDRVPGVNVNDNPNIREEPMRFILEAASGAPWITYYMAMWGAAIVDDEDDPFNMEESDVEAIAANPRGDIRFDFPGYKGSTFLIHWWRYALDPLDIVADTGLGVPRININADGTTDIDDIIEDAPG